MRPVRRVRALAESCGGISVSFSGDKKKVSIYLEDPADFAKFSPAVPPTPSSSLFFLEFE